MLNPPLLICWWSTLCIYISAHVIPIWQHFAISVFDNSITFEGAFKRGALRLGNDEISLQNYLKLVLTINGFCVHLWNLTLLTRLQMISVLTEAVNEWHQELCTTSCKHWWWRTSIRTCTVRLWNVKFWKIEINSLMLSTTNILQYMVHRSIVELLMLFMLYCFSQDYNIICNQLYSSLA